MAYQPSVEACLPSMVVESLVVGLREVAFRLEKIIKLVGWHKLNLNLLCTSNRNPHLSAYADLEGGYDYNAHPLASLAATWWRTKLLVSAVCLAPRESMPSTLAPPRSIIGAQQCTSRPPIASV